MGVIQVWLIGVPSVLGQHIQLCAEHKGLWIWDIVAVRVERVCLTLEVGRPLVKTGCLSGWEDVWRLEFVVLWLKTCCLCGWEYVLEFKSWGDLENSSC